MATNAVLPIVKASGSYRTIGQQIGEAFAPAIQRMVDTYKRRFELSGEESKLTWDEAIAQARRYFPFAQQHTPRYVEELQGTAQAAGVHFDDLLLVNCIEEVMADALHMKCTSIAVSAEHSRNGHTLVGHNEDWWPEDEDSVYMVHAAPDAAPPFLALTYGGLLPNIGFNARGIAQCCDTVYPADARIGLPRIFAARAALAAENLSEAIRAALHPQRAAGYNHLIASSEGELYCLETSACEFAALYGQDGRVVHTNHYLSGRMKRVERDREQLIGTRVRANRATRLLRHAEHHTVQSLQSILSDHVNRPQSICCHMVRVDQPLDSQKTIASMVMDLTALEMYVAWGNPCESTFHTFRLEA